MYASASHRLVVSGLIAALLHAGLILGITFNWTMPQQAAATLDVTLSTHSPELPLGLTEIVQSVTPLNTQGEQVADKDVATTNPATDAIAAKNGINEQHSGRASNKAVKPAAANTQFTQTAEITTAPTLPETANFRLFDQSIGDLVQEIARQSDQRTVDSSNAPNTQRVRRIDGVSPMRTVDAYYLQSWRRKIESVGRLNYPEEAKRGKLSGNMTLLVTIRPDGSLHDVRVLQTSGHSVLDEAALRIVRLAAPYSPFPVDMRQSTDLLEIVRSWQFRRPS